ncbi:MAG: oligosaccharide flippase family protein [Alphaproteobacteria bacterium]
MSRFKNNPTFHTAIYSTSNLLVSAAGLISFPILTRMLSVEDYGILNLIALTLMILVGLGKAGLQRSIIRFGSEARSSASPFGEADIYMTSIVGMLAIVLAIQAVWSVASQFLPLGMVGDARVYPIFVLSGMMVVGQVLYSGISNVFVSEKASVSLSLINVLKRYSWIAVLVPCLLLAENKLQIFYLAGGLHELAFCAIMVIVCSRLFPLFRGKVSRPMLRPLLAYGLPLAGYEMISLVLVYGDRAQISYFLGTLDVGLYAAAYNLCTYLSTVFLISVATAITPMYMDRWEKGGRAETEAFLALVLRYYLMLSLPCAVGASLIGLDLITFLAGEKYTGAHDVIPYVITGMLVDGLTVVMAAGLQIQKRTGSMMAVMAAAAVINLGLNSVLIPLAGIQGAAIGTLLAYLFFTGGCWFLGRRILTVRLEWRPVLIYLLGTAAMALAVLSVGMPSPAANLLVKVMAGALVFAGVVLALDGEIRRIVLGHGARALALLRRRPAFK